MAWLERRTELGFEIGSDQLASGRAIWRVCFTLFVRRRREGVRACFVHVFEVGGLGRLPPLGPVPGAAVWRPRRSGGVVAVSGTTSGLGFGTRSTFFTVGLLLLAQGGAPPVEPGVVPETMATSWSRTRARCWGGIWTLKANAFRKKNGKSAQARKAETLFTENEDGGGLGGLPATLAKAPRKRVQRWRGR